MILLCLWPRPHSPLCWTFFNSCCFVFTFFPILGLSPRPLCQMRDVHQNFFNSSCFTFNSSSTRSFIPTVLILPPSLSTRTSIWISTCVVQIATPTSFPLRVKQQVCKLQLALFLSCFHSWLVPLEFLQPVEATSVVKGIHTAVIQTGEQLATVGWICRTQNISSLGNLQAGKIHIIWDFCPPVG